MLGGFALGSAVLGGSARWIATALKSLALGPNLVYQLQRAVADLLNESEWFADVPVVVVSRRLVTAAVEEALATAGGAAVLIEIEEVGVTELDFGPVFGAVKVACRAIEVPEHNRGDGGTGKEAAEIAEKCLAILHGATPLIANGPLMARSPALLRNAYDRLGDGEALLPEWDAFLELPGNLQAAGLEIVDSPALVVSDGEPRMATLTCATPGAVIYYSTDGLKPGPNHGSVYSAPFPVSGGRLRARARLTGALDSDELDVNV